VCTQYYCTASTQRREDPRWCENCEYWRRGHSPQRKRWPARNKNLFKLPKQENRERGKKEKSVAGIEYPEMPLWSCLRHDKRWYGWKSLENKQEANSGREQYSTKRGGWQRSMVDPLWPIKMRLGLLVAEIVALLNIEALAPVSKTLAQAQGRP
jgi:hypothetical protein